MMEAGNHGIELKPVIKEIVRTQVCFPNIKLLVDRISIVILPGVEDLSKNESFLLLLTDGEKSIQGKKRASFSRRTSHQYRSFDQAPQLQVNHLRRCL